MVSAFTVMMLACGLERGEQPVEQPAPEGCDATLWYPDSDGDGWGRNGASVKACTQPDGFVAQNGDCDDDNDAANPGLDEVCDGFDNDCDQVADEEAIDATRYYADVDQDGYGDPETPVWACSPGPQLSKVAGDCNDASAEDHPEAWEQCDDRDNDCDGLVDEDAADAEIAWPDSDGDGYGDENSDPLRSCSGFDVPTAANDEDCDDGLAEVNPGEEEICGDGIDNDCVEGPGDCFPTGTLSLTEGTAYVGASTGDWAGLALSAGGDLDGDGAGEFVVGAPGNDTTASRAGAAYVIDSTTKTEVGVEDHAVASVYGVASHDLLGTAVLGGQDLNDDGLADLAVGAPEADDTGQVYLFTGPMSGTLSIGTADAVITGAGEAGVALGSGDFDGDGVTDLIVGDPSAYYSSIDTGAAFVFYGPLSGSLTPSTDAIIMPDYYLSGAGRQVASAGDLDADGVDDLLISLDKWSSGGQAVFALSGPPAAGLNLVDETSSGVITEDSTGDGLGDSLAPIGDVDGNGYDDFLVGAGNAEGGAGAVYLVLGPTGTGERTISSAADVTFVGNFAGEGVGWDATMPGDVDGDGHDDYLIGAWGAGTGNEGGAYVVLGTVSSGTYVLAKDATTELLGDESWSYVGETVAGAGDVDGDGVDDFVVAGSWAQSQRGVTYLMQGLGL